MLNGAGAIGAISAAFVLTGEIFDPDSKVMALQVAQGNVHIIDNYQSSASNSSSFHPLKIKRAYFKLCLALVRLSLLLSVIMLQTGDTFQ